MSFREIRRDEKELYFDYVDRFYHSDAVEAPVPPSHYEATFNELMRSDDYLKCYIFEPGGGRSVRHDRGDIHRRGAPRQRTRDGVL